MILEIHVLPIVVQLIKIHWHIDQIFFHQIMIDVTTHLLYTQKIEFLCKSFKFSIDDEIRYEHLTAEMSENMDDLEMARFVDYILLHEYICILEKVHVQMEK